MNWIKAMPQKKAFGRHQRGNGQKGLARRGTGRKLPGNAAGPQVIIKELPARVDKKDHKSELDIPVQTGWSVGALEFQDKRLL